MGLLKNLADLTVYLHNYNDINKFKDIKNLESLGIKASNISNIESLSAFTGLKSLLINSQDLNLSFLKGLPQLEKLEVICNTIQNPDTLTSLSNLKHLTLNTYDTYSIMGGIASEGTEVDFTKILESMHNLEELYFYNAGKITSLDVLSNLPKIKKFMVTRNIKKEWIESLIDLNVVCMTPKEMRKVTYDAGDALKLEVICFEIQEDVVKVVLECYWVNNTNAMNGGYAEFDAQKSDGKWVVEAKGYANY
mgnify:CR=1 FL=1